MNFHILLVGDGPAYPELENYAHQNDIIEKGVTFTGAVARNMVPKYIAAFDIAIQPDVTDYACPIKLIEYMGMRKAIVAPDKENITEILTDKYRGLFNANNFDNMARTIIHIAKSKKHMEELGVESEKILYQNNYIWVHNAKKTLEQLKG